MQKVEFLQLLAQKILKRKQNKVFVVWINGVDGSWKTYLWRELYKYFEDQWYRVDLISVDDFLNPREERYKKWIESPEGFYYDSYNYEDFITYVLRPFSEWKWKFCRKIFDIEQNIEIEKMFLDVGSLDIVIVEGIFLFRPELIDSFDYKIFLDVSFDVILQRNIYREADKRIGEQKEIIERYQKRYIPGQKLYFQIAHPQAKSDIIIDNNDYNNPKIFP